MALAGHPVVVSCKSSNAAVAGADEINGLNSIGYSPKIEMLDVTDFQDTSAAKLKLAGLTDGQIQGSGDLEPADAPQTLIRTSWASGASIWFTLAFNPGGGANTVGFKVECKISAFEVKASAEGKVEFSFTAEFTGAPALV